MIILVYFADTGKRQVDSLSLADLNGDPAEAILARFRERGFPRAVKPECLYVKTDSDVKHFDPKLLENGDVTIYYMDVHAPQNAVIYARVNGFLYFFHTSEGGHENYPHVHVRYSGEEFFISLRDFKPPKKLPKKIKSRNINEAIEYVKAHKEELMDEWNRIHGKS